MSDSFLGQVQSELGAELDIGQFEFQHSDTDLGSGEVRVFFRGPASTLMLYDSPRNGEVNAKICYRHLPASALANLSAHKWHYLSEFIPELSAMSFEQLLERVPTKPISTKEQLQNIKALLLVVSSLGAMESADDC